MLDDPREPAAAAANRVLSKVRKLRFTVDAALIEELGERLVGRAHIALAELIKNSYDADATLVSVRFGADEIEVVDNGHGMTAETFEAYWMRIGSPHKREQRVTREGRPMTGSKGVGRLAAQFLASRLTLSTRARGGSTLSASVDWDQAVRAVDLTEATAEVEDDAPPETFAGGSRVGTRLVLSGLREEWDSDALRELARVLWPLQPPFLRSAGVLGFEVQLETGDEEAREVFEEQMGAVLDLWTARIRGRLLRDSRRRELDVAVQFADGERFRMDVPSRLTHLDKVDFEIRVFDLRYRQPFGIGVEEAREYLRRFGGVHIYDAGFHLPYYGADTDWLGIEQAHSHRLSQSKLLPAELQVHEGLNYLPTTSRLYGVVNVDTGHEQACAGDPRRALTIQVSRDRLIDNAAFRELETVVRTALDFYATRAAIRAARLAEREPAGDLLSTRAQQIDEVIESIRDEVPATTLRKLRREVARVQEAAETEAERIASQAGLLGALATAGISAVAYEHEAARQLRQLDRLRRKIATLGPEGKQASQELAAWIERSSATRELFSPLLDDENRQRVQRLRAGAVLEQVAEQTSFLLRGVHVDLSGVDEDVRLPAGRFAEWTALFQNVFVNAANAMLESQTRILAGRTRHYANATAVLVMDTGAGIDLERADHFFEPFARAQHLSAERRGLGVGGTGLGLTIVRMLATNLHATVDFVEPPAPFSTAFRVRWRSE